MIFGMFIFECSECQLVTTFCLALCNISFVEGWKASQIMVLDVLPDGARERRHGTPERERERDSKGSRPRREEHVVVSLHRGTPI